MEKIGIEKRSPAEPLPNLDFGTSWGGFGKVLVWFWGAVEIDFLWEISHVRKTRVAAERASKRVAVGNVQKGSMKLSSKFEMVL